MQSKYATTGSLVGAAVSLWLFSLWVETRWPWASDPGSPWALISSPSWWKALALWVAWWLCLGGYFVLRWRVNVSKPHTWGVFLVVGLLHFLLLLFLDNPPPYAQKVLLVLTNHRVLGVYSVLKGRLPSFVAGSLTWLVLTEALVTVLTASLRKR